jgi:hypothetical protein
MRLLRLTNDGPASEPSDTDSAAPIVGAAHWLAFSTSCKYNDAVAELRLSDRSTNLDIDAHDTLKQVREAAAKRILFLLN